jgi:hypothetical protein
MTDPTPTLSDTSESSSDEELFPASYEELQGTVPQSQLADDIAQFAAGLCRAFQTRGPGVNRMDERGPAKKKKKNRSSHTSPGTSSADPKSPNPSTIASTSAATADPWLTTPLQNSDPQTIMTLKAGSLHFGDAQNKSPPHTPEEQHDETCRCIDCQLRQAQIDEPQDPKPPRKPRQD